MFSGMNYVYEVYKEQSFSKAAENLYISQPALSSMIKKIETKIGMPLFDRSTSPIQLTECGKKYIKTAEKIMDLENEFAYYVGNLQELKTGRLSVGGTYLFSSFIFQLSILNSQLLQGSPKASTITLTSNGVNERRFDSYPKSYRRCRSPGHKEIHFFIFR